MALKQVRPHFDPFPRRNPQRKPNTNGRDTVDATEARKSKALLGCVLEGGSAMVEECATGEMTWALDTAARLPSPALNRQRGPVDASEGCAATLRFTEVGPGRPSPPLVRERALLPPCGVRDVILVSSTSHPAARSPRAGLHEHRTRGRARCSGVEPQRHRPGQAAVRLAWAAGRVERPSYHGAARDVMAA